MKWHIITDSSSDLQDFEIEEYGIKYSTIPFAFNIGNKTIIDSSDLNTESLLEEISKTKEKVSTACPSPYDFEEKMKDDANYIIITISGALSGSYNSATLAKNTILEKYVSPK